MKRFNKVIATFVMAVMLSAPIMSGCSKQDYVDSGILISSYNSSNEKFGYLYEQFKLNNQFSADEKITLMSSQAVILSLIEDFQDDSIGGGIKIENFEVYIKQFAKHYRKIKHILDKYIAQYPKSTRIIYKESVDDVDKLFALCNKVLKESEKGELDIKLITKYAEELIDAIGPLIGTAL